MKPLIHRTQVRVTYAETDAMGVVYYANYLRWLEVGRTELMRSLGVAYKEMEEGGAFLPVSEVFGTL
jgi:acyl-CoA thioester hydrolase